MCQNLSSAHKRATSLAIDGGVLGEMKSDNEEDIDDDDGEDLDIRIDDVEPEEDG